MGQFGDSGVWAAREFGGVDLGDARRTQRLVQIAAGVASQVGCALSSVCGKSGSQATTSLNFTSHACTDGLDPITTAEGRQGLLMHSVLAVSVDRVPLGLLGVQV